MLTRKLGLVLVSLVVVALVVLLAWAVEIWLRPPLFQRWANLHAVPNETLLDPYGGRIYFDEPRNIIALVRSRQLQTVFTAPTSNRAVASFDVDGADIAIRGKPDTLFVIVGALQEDFPIPPGTAARWKTTFDSIYNVDPPRPDVMHEVMSRYEGADSARLKQFIESALNAQKHAGGPGHP